MSKLLDQMLEQGFKERKLNEEGYVFIKADKDGGFMAFSEDEKTFYHIHGDHDVDKYSTTEYPQKIADILYVNGIKPFFSQGICEQLTAGYGNLSEFGYWQYDLYVDPDSLSVTTVEDTIGE